MGIVQEFRDFAVKGNAMDLAVGVVIGAAFTKIVNSIVSDLIMPPIGLLVGDGQFKDWKIVLRAAEGGKPEVGIMIGSFLDNVVQFFIIAVSVFLVIKVMNKLIAARGNLIGNLPGISSLPGIGNKKS
ncbi:MAG: large conductance mechanosensitive channel protein MscL [Phycisphaerales bacterium]